MFKIGENEIMLEKILKTCACSEVYLENSESPEVIVVVETLGSERCEAVQKLGFDLMDGGMIREFHVFDCEEFQGMRDTYKKYKKVV